MPDGSATYSNSLQVDNANEAQERMATNEFERYAKCRHPSIMRCFGMGKDEDGNWCLLLEHAEHGDLNKFYAKLKSAIYMASHRMNSVQTSAINWSDSCWME